MAASQSMKLAQVEAFLQNHPHITLVTPSSPRFASLTEIFCLDNHAVPLAVVRPQSASDVSLLLKFVIAEDIKFVVRTGGHNLFGLSQVEGALTIDMRDISYVQVQEGNLSAKIGGGILQGDLAAELSKEGLVTATGTVSSVGYVGWATYGGYGPFSANFGLGADHILGAKIVDSTGDIVEADENLLKGIRGAGGLFGIIVEVTIKVHPLRTIFAGTIIYESQNIKATFENFNARYRELSAKGLPSPLTVQQLIVNSPFGKVMALGFVWSSEDVEGGKAWLALFEAFGTVVMNTVAIVSISDWLAALTAMVPKGAYGSSHTHNLRELNNEVIEVIGSALEKMPSSPATMFSIHQSRGVAAQPNSNSVFGTREPHFMLEILGYSSTEDDSTPLKWAAELHEAINQMHVDIILPGIYISLEAPAQKSGPVPLSRIYGSNDQAVLSLKQQYDSKNVFDNAVPRLENYL